MWGEILGSLFGAALESANNDADNETKIAQSQYQLAIEQEKTRQQKEAQKHDTITTVLNGVFGMFKILTAKDSTSSGSGRD